MTVTIGRRELLAAIGGTAAWPLAARAQQGERVRRIGVLTSLAADDPESQARHGAFLQGLQESGWSVGRNVRIDYRFAAGDPELCARYAAELVALAPEVILSEPHRTIYLTGIDPNGKVARASARRRIRAMADGTLDSQVGARICNGLGIMRACLETEKLEQLEARMEASRPLPTDLLRPKRIWTGAMESLSEKLRVLHCRTLNCGRTRHVARRKDP